MKLSEAIEAIHPPKGVTSIIAGVLSGDYESAFPHEAVEPTLAKAEAEVERFQRALDNARSDFAYWGILGDLAHWKAVRDLLKAAAITGPDALPDVEPPKAEGRVVMDLIYDVEQWGKEVLRRAERVGASPVEEGAQG